MKLLISLLFGLVAQAGAANYSTAFPKTEAPISEGGRWIQGQADGRDWRDCNSTPGFAYGTQTGQVKYDDSTAVLTGSWGPDQTAQATVVVRTATSNIAEVELRLRTTLTTGRNSGYEFNFSVSTAQVYAQIVRWNGPLGDFKLLDSRAIKVNSGDVVKATAIGSTLTLYVNGSAKYSVQDSTFKSGSPGIGFYVNTSGINNYFGLTNFSATDGNASPTPTPTVAPTPTPNPTPNPTPTPKSNYSHWRNKWSQWIHDNPAQTNP